MNDPVKPEATERKAGEGLAAASGSALPAAPLDLGRLINSLPPDVNKKLSLHDLKRIADNYNTGPCPNCYGGHFRPCQWCGDTGTVTMMPNAELCHAAEPQINMNEVETVEEIRCLKLAVGDLQQRVSSLEKPPEKHAVSETVGVKALASANGSEALQQLKSDRELMKRIVKIGYQYGNRELVEMAKLEGAKIYASIYYMEKTKPQNDQAHRSACDKP